MDELINELRIALNNKLYFISVSIALVVPDICSAIQSSNGKASGAKYKRWFNDYITPKYNGFLDGEDVYKLRCASVHQGKYNSNYRDFNKIAFQLPNENMITTHCIITNDCLTLNIVEFVKDIIQGYDEWKLNMVDNPFYETNLNRCFKYHPRGLSSYIIGVPIIA